MKFDEYVSPQEIHIINLMKNANRMEKDEILGTEVTKCIIVDFAVQKPKK